MNCFLKVFLITFVFVAIFRKSNDENDNEFDHQDNGDPIYLDQKIGDLNLNLKILKVILEQIFPVKSLM